MNTQENSDLSTDLSTGVESIKPARPQSFASVIDKDRDGDWYGKTQWLFDERPALVGDEPGQWIIELRTKKDVRGIVNCWSVVQVVSSGSGFSTMRFKMFGDYSHREQAHNWNARATSGAIAEAHVEGVQQIERIAEAAVDYYLAKAQKEALRA